MRLEEAEAALLEAHGILVAGLGAEHDLTQGTVNALVELYDAWDEPDEADEWRSKLPRRRCTMAPEEDRHARVTELYAEVCESVGPPRGGPLTRRTGA